MDVRFRLIIMLLLLSGIGFTQNNVDIIHANSEEGKIRIGDQLGNAFWNGVLEFNPYILKVSNLNETITIYTDVDSISYVINRDSTYNLIVLLNGIDSAKLQIKYSPSYLDILKKGEKYDYSENQEIPNFTYQDSSNVNLKALRSKLKLDSVAGHGNEISKIINLMHWIHDLIPHDIRHKNPVVKNAMSMINECKDEDRGLNCRGLATVLNECYLAIGIKSRFITCMPKDTIFEDCHVINMVYSSELQNWIWIDPTHNAYIMDETGRLLGLEEVRDRLINNQPLILNPDANWNRKTSTVKEYYLLEYMAKNLYRFSCPLKSEYNFETFDKGKNIEYIELLSMDAHSQSPKFVKKYNENSKVTFFTYKTNNPNLFWKKPD